MQRFKNIIFVATPDDNSSRAAFERVLALAEHNQARVKVIDIIDDFPRGMQFRFNELSIRDLRKKILSAHRDALEEWLTSFQTQEKIEAQVLAGVSFIEIIREVMRGDHDLVIKVAQSDDTGMARVFGSDDMHLLRKCPCPVLLMKPGADKVFHRILAAVDMDDNYPSEELSARHLLNLQILEMASSLALSESAELSIASAWRAVGESIMKGGFIKCTDQEVEEHIEEARQKCLVKVNRLMGDIIPKLGADAITYLEPTIQLLKGWPRQEIPTFAEKINADLVVMGTVGRTGVSGLIIGNTAEAIINQINCSVLAIKPDGFKTPVTL